MEMKVNHSCICSIFCQSSAVNPSGSGLPIYLAAMIESARRDMVVMFGYWVILNNFCILVIKGMYRSAIYWSYWLWESIVLSKLGMKAGQGKKLKEQVNGYGRYPSGRANYRPSSFFAPGKGGTQRCSGTFLSFGPLPKGYMPQSRLLKLWMDLLSSGVKASTSQGVQLQPIKPSSDAYSSFNIPPKFSSSLIPTPVNSPFLVDRYLASYNQFQQYLAPCRIITTTCCNSPATILKSSIMVNNKILLVDTFILQLQLSKKYSKKYLSSAKIYFILRKWRFEKKKDRENDHFFVVRQTWLSYFFEEYQKSRVLPLPPNTLRYGLLFFFGFYVFDDVWFSGLTLPTGVSGNIGALSSSISSFSFFFEDSCTVLLISWTSSRFLQYYDLVILSVSFGIRLIPFAFLLICALAWKCDYDSSSMIVGFLNSDYPGEFCLSNWLSSFSFSSPSFDLLTRSDFLSYFLRPAFQSALG